MRAPLTFIALRRGAEMRGVANASGWAHLSHRIKLIDFRWEIERHLPGRQLEYIVSDRYTLLFLFILHNMFRELPFVCQMTSANITKCDMRTTLRVPNYFNVSWQNISPMFNVLTSHNIDGIGQLGPSFVFIACIRPRLSNLQR